MVSWLLNQIRDIMARKMLTAEEQMNMISGLQIWFDKQTKETWVLNGVLLAQIASAPPPPAPAALPKVVTEKGIGPNINFDNSKTSRISKKKTAMKNKWINISKLTRVLYHLQWQE